MCAEGNPTQHLTLAKTGTEPEAVRVPLEVSGPTILLGDDDLDACRFEVAEVIVANAVVGDERVH